jgi:hypothetical protein
MKGNSMDIAVLTKSQSIIHDVIDSEAVVMNLEAGVYFSFNVAATKIWEKIISEQLSEQELLKFAGQHNGKFIEFLLDQKVIRRELSSTIKTQETMEPLGEIETAEWQTFSDLQDLLLLDPVHDIALNDQGWPETRRD